MTALVVRYGRLVRFSHTVFAMPFALAAIALAPASVAAPPGTLALRLALVVWCMVAARTCAMCVNRLVDRRMDAANPRTASRELVTGEVGVRGATALAVGSGAAFVAGAGALGEVTLWASVPVLALLCGYSLAKRFTWATHLWLGVAIGLAPLGAAVAWTGTVPSASVLVLAAGVACWVAGFDVLYALADEAFDRANRVHSIPARFGTRAALWIAAVLHVVAAAAFLESGWLARAGVAYFAGVGVVGVFLLLQHGVPRLRLSVFKLNGAVGIAFLAAVLMDGALR
jgi:4-hydroxybenzoate polyprenyltransferase